MPPDDKILSLNLKTRIKWALLAVFLGIMLAGFWNYKVVDGLGHDLIAGKTIGETKILANSFAENGFGFGFIFAMIAGLAATFTACNCVVFAMIPGLTCSNKTGKNQVLKLLIYFICSVLFVSLIYGLYIGSLGKTGAITYNLLKNRLIQAQITFSFLGIVMFIWGLLSLDFFPNIVKKIPQGTIEYFSKIETRTVILGIMVGLFSVGRPFPVFRDFLTYAAEAKNPFYGALVMMIQGLGQIAVMVILTVSLVFFFGKKLGTWVKNKPQQSQLISSFALIMGGIYFVYYWGLSFLFNIGQWGFKLGWYK